MHLKHLLWTVLDLVVTCLMLSEETKGQDCRKSSDSSVSLPEIKSFPAFDGTGTIKLDSHDKQHVDISNTETLQQDLTGRSDGSSLIAMKERSEIKAKNNNIDSEDKPGIFVLTDNGIEKCSSGLSIYEILMGHKNNIDEHDSDMPHIIYSSGPVQVIRPPQQSRRSREQDFQTGQAPVTYNHNLLPNNGYQNTINWPSNVNNQGLHDSDMAHIIYSSGPVQVIRPPQQSRCSREQHFQTGQAPMTYNDNLLPNNGYQNTINLPSNVNNQGLNVYGQFPVNKFENNPNQQVNPAISSFTSNQNKQPLQVNQPSPVVQPLVSGPSNINTHTITQPVYQYVNQQHPSRLAFPVQHSPYDQGRPDKVQNQMEFENYSDDYTDDYDNDDDDAWYDEVYSDNQDIVEPYFVQPYRRQHNGSQYPTKRPSLGYQVYTKSTEAPLIPVPGSNTTNATSHINATATNNTKPAVVLTQIMHELNCIKSDRVVNSSAEGSPCNIAGSWVSEAAGVRFDITSNASGYLSVAIGDVTPARKKGFMLSGGWSITGESRFLMGGPFYLTATQDLEKRIAVFIGECHICQLEDLVTGSWVTSRVARDCRDSFISTMGKTDIFHRESLHVLRDERKNLLGCHVNVTSTTTVESIDTVVCTTPKPCKRHHKPHRDRVKEAPKRHCQLARERRRHLNAYRHRNRMVEEEEDDDYGDEEESRRHYRHKYRNV